MVHPRYLNKNIYAFRDIWHITPILEGPYPPLSTGVDLVLTKMKVSPQFHLHPSVPYVATHLIFIPGKRWSFVNRGVFLLKAEELI